VLAAQLETAQKALSKEKSSRSAIAKALADEKAARKVAEQDSKKSIAELSQELEVANTLLTATHDKLASKSATLDNTVILRDEVNLQWAKSEEKLWAVEEELKTQEQSLESARQALSRSEISSNMVITSAVAHVVALFKNHLPDLDVEIPRKDFVIDDTARETLVASAYDAAQDFVSSYDFASLTESKDNDRPRNLRFFSVCSTEHLLI
jgi:flagellar motility protein MotE (MotC chaperone)